MISIFHQMNHSAGILVYRIRQQQPEVLLGHPGGPFWSKKNIGTWSIPKGEINPQEQPLVSAKREFFEETGIQVDGEFTPLQSIRMKSGKIVHAWAVEADPDLSAFVSNTFEIVWPPKSNTTQQFPELDQLEWFSLDEGKSYILPAQLPFLDRLQQQLGR